MIVERGGDCASLTLNHGICQGSINLKSIGYRFIKRQYLANQVLLRKPLNKHLNEYSEQKKN